jgi:tripartite-type tricarboxylate transporter receptor subunit TctC
MAGNFLQEACMRFSPAASIIVATATVMLSTTVIAQSTSGTATAPADPAPNYPNRAIRVVVPYPAGGTSDILMRLITQKLTEKWGQQFVIEPRPGAAGLIGTEIVARAQPDGYTLLATDMGSVMISWLSHPKPPFDYLRDLTPVMVVAYSPHVLCVHPSMPVRTPKELIAVAKKRPGELNFAASLAGAPLMAGIDFAHRAGIRWTYITGRGGMQTIMDVVTGQADAFFNGMLPTVPHIQSGRLRLLAVSSEKRVASMPDAPTIAESGMPGFLTGSWQGVMAPAGTPPEIVAKLHMEMSRALAMADIKQKLAAQGTDPRYNSPAETSKALQSERDRLVKLIRETNFKPGQG